MPSFSKISLDKLLTCHVDLQNIFNEVIKTVDCKILVGERTETEQNAAYRDRLSKLKYPNSFHNSSPSMAVDVAIYPIDWKKTNRFYWFAGYVLAIVDYLYNEKIISNRVRWGGDWDKDRDFDDQKLYDLVHFELISS